MGNSDTKYNQLNLTWIIGAGLVFLIIVIQFINQKYGEGIVLPLLWGCSPIILAVWINTKFPLQVHKKTTPSTSHSHSPLLLLWTSRIYFLVLLAVLLYFQPSNLIYEGIRLETTLGQSLWVITPLSLLVIYLVFFAKSVSQEPVLDTLKILFLAANASDSTRLRLGKEIKEIEEGIMRSLERNRFVIVQKWDVTSTDFIQALLDERPNIVHFSGHGLGPDEDTSGTRQLEFEEEESQSPSGIALLDESGKSKLVSGEALATLFAPFTQNISCVILNSCYSEEQALYISQKIPSVIGMKTAVPDEVAIDFSIGFYRALGSGESLPKSYEIGKSHIAARHGIQQADLPVWVGKRD